MFVYVSIIEGEVGVEVEILRVNATDADEGENAAITYSLIGAPRGLRIVPTTGVVLANRSALAARADLRIAIRAQDGGNPPRHAVAALRVRARAVGQAKPHFAKDDYR